MMQGPRAVCRERRAVTVGMDKPSIQEEGDQWSKLEYHKCSLLPTEYPTNPVRLQEIVPTRNQISHKYRLKP